MPSEERVPGYSMVFLLLEVPELRDRYVLKTSSDFVELRSAERNVMAS